MDKYDVILTPLAKDDIIKITNYLVFEKRAPEAALKTTENIEKTIYSLDIIPQRHEIDKTPVLAFYHIRKLYYKNYKIFYLIDETNKIVYVLSVLHTLVDSQSIMVRMFRD